MTVRLSGALSDFVSANVSENGSYENVSEYVRDLIRCDQVHESGARPGIGRSPYRRNLLILPQRATNGLSN